MTTAKPAGEPRPHWTLEDFDDATMTVVELREDGRFRAHVLRDAAERIVSALNAAETRAAQPPELGGGMKALELYYAQKDGCKRHQPGVGKICLECVADAINEARAAQPGDAPKLTEDALHDAELRLDEARWWDMSFGLSGDVFDVARSHMRSLEESVAALLASRSTQAAPAAKPAGEPRPPVTLPERYVLMDTNGNCLSWGSGHPVKFESFEAALARAEKCNGSRPKQNPYAVLPESALVGER